MPVEIQPVDRAVLYCRFSGTITDDDLITLTRQEETFFSALPPDEAIDVIADVSTIDLLPARLFPQLIRLQNLYDSRLAHVAIVGATPYLRAMATSLGIMTSQQKYLFCDTLADAQKLFRAGQEPNPRHHRR
ncbi:MAG: STAS/SEC14 domain-containing protein [Chloroflexi bacterium]|nr:STAS/SEC14 domain-containing protein [Chloroflexota bacterium]